uniref:Uncharacterized protein n=1 Tax=Populus trichocarpa TaxID=3694 RepID=A0A2K2B590_POPTR
MGEVVAGEDDAGDGVSENVLAPSKVVPISEVAANELNVETRMTSEKAMETPKRLISLLKREVDNFMWQEDL